MKKFMVTAIVLAFAMLLLVSESVDGGRGRGGGGRGGGFSGGARGGNPGGGQVIRSYGGGPSPGAYSGGRTTSPIVGPGGGAGQVSRGSGSYTTKGGSTIDYKGATVGGTTGGGVQGARHVGGVQVTTPGGKQVTNVGKSGIAQGPGGNVVGGKTGAAVGTGPQGAIGTKYQGGVAIGPQGGIAGKTQGGIATGPGGTVVGGSHGTIAGGAYGTVGGRTTAIAGQGGTYYRSTAAIRGQGVYVRQGVANYPCFRPGWYTQHPGAWFAAGWAASSVWRAANWGTCSTYCGISGEPIYYDYGETVTYQDNSVYISGEMVASAEQYYQQANTLADTGRDAKVTQEEEWLPLGVFAMVQGEEKTSNHIFQLAVNKQGVIRGNYYDAVTDTTSQVFGSVDQKTQRAAWTVGDRKTPVYEVGIANLTKKETTMLVHYAKDRSQQFTLIRIEEPEKTQ
jgi:hypothetical protein